MADNQFSLYDRPEPALEGVERELVESVSRDVPWGIVEEFADLRRISPSDDERRAAALIEDHFDDFGVPYDRYDPEFWLSVPHSASVTVLDPPAETFAGSDDDFDTEQPAVKTLSFAGAGTASGEAVVLDMPEIGSSKEALEDAAVGDRGVDLEGKVVVVDTLTVAKQFFREIEERGAAALVSIHPHENEPGTTTATPIWGAIPTPDEQHLVPEMPNVTVSRDVGDRLLKRIEESEGTLELEVTADLSRGWHECPLVVAEIQAGARETDDFVLLHGHLDSWYYGVTDNATGNASMVELARVLNEHRDELQRNLRIAFWPAHEGGRYGGSAWYADEFATDIVEHCVAHVNCDSPGVKDATAFNMTMWQPEADALCRAAIDEVTGKAATGYDRTPRAGDYAFYNLGVTGMMGLSSGIPESIREERGYAPVGGSGGNSLAWHRTEDTIDVADPAVLARDTKVYLVILARLLRRDVLPLDHRRTIDRHREYLQDYRDAAAEHFDLSSVLDELDALDEALASFYAAVEANDIAAEAANEAITAVSRRLTRLSFTEKGPFEQDPATSRPPYPLLAPVTELPELQGDEYRFQLTALRRNRNAVVNALREARRAIPTAD